MPVIPKISLSPRLDPRRRLPVLSCLAPSLSALLAALLMPLLIAMPVQAQVAEQTVDLVAGWNAVWLEVQPTSEDGSILSPEEVFTPEDITLVASPKVLSGVSEFFSSAPTNGTFRTVNREGWTQWLRNPPVGDENNMVAVPGNRPYLIQAVAPVTLTLQGKVEFFRPSWTPDRYNLVGFGLDPINPPTFAEFFSPSGNRHPVDEVDRSIYALATDGNWTPVSGGDVMRSGEAYWVFCRGNSSYMGPVAVSFDYQVLGRLNFGGPINAVPVGEGTDQVELDLEEVVFSNLGPDPVVPTLAFQPDVGVPGQFPDDLVLEEVEPRPNSLGWVRGATVGPDFRMADGQPVGANTTAILTLGATRDWSAGSVERVNLYRLGTGAGSEFWLPVRALHNDFQLSGDLPPAAPAGSADPQLAGLWVGEVNVDTATSIVEDGAPARPAAGSAPIRILLHADTNGVIQLLSQVTMMQTKTADPGVEPVSVLVVNPARIPFFEGIQERQGKRVGLRLESVAFDMPRKLDPATQAALVAAVAHKATLGSTADILDYLNSQASRPPSLVEDYHFTWPLEGSLGAGQTVRTASAAPLNLDPFHRSNPFRHAFHKQHARGPNIEREVELVFDTQASLAGVLRGQYRETIRGLVKGALELNGPVELRQVSNVVEVEQ